MLNKKQALCLLFIFIHHEYEGGLNIIIELSFISCLLLIARVLRNHQPCIRIDLPLRNG
jgi:hypothetical protein